MSISEKLLEHIEKARDRGESILSIARAAGIAEPSLNRFVNRQRSISLDYADRLAEYFGLELKPAKPSTKGKRK